MTTVFKRGGAGEPYCSAACSEKGGNAIFDVSIGSQQSHLSRCITCGAQAMTGNAMATDYRLEDKAKS